MIRFRQIVPVDKEYTYVEQLLESTFPPSERRDRDAQRANASGEEGRFKCCIALGLSDEPVGLFTFWNFTSFIYCEHLAVEPKFRGRGYGGKIVKEACRSFEVPLVLEVELPDTSEARRRIEFYLRCGMTLHSDFEYYQPPYRESDSPLPMLLMTSQPMSVDRLREVAEVIHRNVYPTFGAVYSK